MYFGNTNFQLGQLFYYLEKSRTVFLYKGLKTYITGKKIFLKLKINLFETVKTFIIVYCLAVLLFWYLYFKKNGSMVINSAMSASVHSFGVDKNGVFDALIQNCPTALKGTQITLLPSTKYKSVTSPPLSKLTQWINITEKSFQPSIWVFDHRFEFSTIDLSFRPSANHLPWHLIVEFFSSRSAFTFHPQFLPRTPSALFFSRIICLSLSLRIRTCVPQYLYANSCVMPFFRNLSVLPWVRDQT